MLEDERPTALFVRFLGQKWLERCVDIAVSRLETSKNRNERSEFALRSGRVRKYAEHRRRKIRPRSGFLEVPCSR
jgi:hypothetical protein